MPASFFSLRTFLSRLLLSLSIIGLLWQSVLAQESKPQKISPAEFFTFFANQPDASSEIVVTADIPQLGSKYVSRIRIARKNGRVRREIFPLENETNLRSRNDKDYKIVLLSSAGHPGIAFDPQAKTYAEVPSEFEASVFDLDTLLKNKAKDLERVRLENFGPVKFGGRRATKLGMTEVGSRETVFFYLADEPKNLLIGADSNIPGQSSLVVSNISTELPDDLFSIPDGYSRIDFALFLRAIRSKVVVPPSSRKDTGTRVPLRLKPASESPPAPINDADIATEVDTQPVQLNKPFPNYTEAARKNHTAGTVVLRLLVGPDGAPREAKVISGLPDGLDEEAVRAAMQTRYRPAKKNGKAVACWIETTIEFKVM